MTTLEILREGRRRIAEVGWCQGTWHRQNADGVIIAFCALAALPAEADPYMSATRALEATLRRRLGQWPIGGIPVWQDHPERTVEDVLELYDDTIARLEQAAAKDGVRP